MATNIVKCLCGHEAKASSHILHIGDMWRELEHLGLLEFQKLHRMVESTAIVQIRRFPDRVEAPRPETEARLPRKRK
jgi:hypothetical protein